MAQKDQDFVDRATLLAEAVGRLPPDDVTVSALFEVAVSAAIAVMSDPSVARVLFESRIEEYERHWSGGHSHPPVRH